MRLGRTWGILIGASVVLAGILLWPLLKGERIEEGRCRLSPRKAGPDSPLLGLACQILEPQKDRPDALRDLPTDFQNPSYYCLKSGDKRIPVVVDLSERFRLCLDTDGNGMLSQEPCFAPKAVRTDQTQYWRFGPISTLGRVNQDRPQSGFYAQAYRRDTPGPLFLYPASYRIGKLRLDGQIYRVAVVDGDYDGQYASLLSLPLGTRWRTPGCDLFAIDLNRDGRFELSLYRHSEVMPLGRMLAVGASYYAVDLASDGTSLALSRTEPKFGRLVIEPNDTSACLALWSDAACQYLSGGDEWQIPAGRYKAVNAEIDMRDPSGDVWTLWSNVSQSSAYGYVRLGPLDFFEIRPEETTSLRIGPPFTIRAGVQQTSPGKVSISPALVGCGGEEYQMNFRRNNRRPPEREFKIIDEKGSVLVADRFQYG